MLLAKTGKAARRLSEQFRSRQVAKVYWAIVTGAPAEDTGVWTDVIAKDRSLNRAFTEDGGTGAGKDAVVAFGVLWRSAASSKLELEPRSGRSHQLRVQLASRGFPIVGDLKYGSSVRLKASDGHWRIALHARQITFLHPTRREPITVVAPVGVDWPEPMMGGAQQGGG